MKLVACIAEDRRGAEIGLKLAILSLNEHCPDVPIILHRPDPIPSFVRWVSRYPQVVLKTERFANWQDWNCKPDSLLQALHEYPDAQALWIDSDMVVTRDPRTIMDHQSPAVLILPQEPMSQPNQGSECRTTAWGWPVGIRYPYTFNSSIFRVSACHIRLLERWRELQADPAYVAVYKLPLDQRPQHLLSDQDVLTGMLGSAEFADHQVHMLPHGQDVIHCGGALGFSLGERLQGIFRPLPTFLHAVGGKPWVLMKHAAPPRIAAHVSAGCCRKCLLTWLMSAATGTWLMKTWTGWTSTPSRGWLCVRLDWDIGRCGVCPLR